jgi:hypothetical protein
VLVRNIIIRLHKNELNGRPSKCSALCYICNGSVHLKSSVVVGLKGLKTSDTKRISELRNDGLIKKFEGVKSIEIHFDCRQKYIFIIDNIASTSGDKITSHRSSLPHYLILSCTVYILW